jgi:hypothetical protein
MKKLAAVLLLAVGVAGSPAQAQHHHHHGGGGGQWVGPMIGGLILGGIIADANRPRVYVAPPPPVVYAPPPPVYVPPGIPPGFYRYPECRTEYLYNSYGVVVGTQSICN